MSVDEQAENMFSRLVKECADRHRVTELLKVENQLLWVRNKQHSGVCTGSSRA